MQFALTADKVYIGKEGLADHPLLVHDGLTFRDTSIGAGQVGLTDMHIDEETFKVVKQSGKAGRDAFAILLLHEGLHVQGFNHPSGDGGTNGVYITPPFDQLSGANACLRP